MIVNSLSIFRWKKTFCLMCLLVAIFFLFGSLFADAKNSPKILKFNLISEFNGKGLEAHQRILAEAIEKLGHQVTKMSWNETQKSGADINIFFERIKSEKLSWAKINWFVPDPEWYTQDLKLLNKMDLIVCFTHEAERIFRGLNKATYYLGFTSVDCYQPEIQKDYFHFLHLAGEGFFRGTTVLQKIWLSNPYLPLLTVIRHPSDFVSQQSNLQWIPYRVPLEQLRLLQNQCGIHLCPTETEGFGHYIMEAMSAGCVVLTTNAPPMNEFIHDPRCLIAYSSVSPMNLGTSYHVDPKDLENKLAHLMSLPPTELASIGLNNRMIYLQKKQEFHENLKELLWLFSNSLP